MKKILALSLLLLTSSGLHAEDLTSRDFAAGYYLNAANGGPLYMLQLPDDVYRTVQRADLEDIRVFNGAGEVVPHSLRAVAADPEAASQKENVPIFPLYQNRLPAQQSDLAMRVTRNNSGTIVNIEAGPQAGSGTPRVSGYLLDLSGAQKVTRELELFWQKSSESSVFIVSIQQSNDLERWTPLVSRATLVDLQYGGQMVERRRVQLPYKPMKYLKLSWQESGQPLDLLEVNGYSQVIASRQQRQWLDLYNGVVKVADDQVEIGFQSSFHLPATSAQLRFPESNSIAKVALQSRANDKAGWITRCEQVFYSLNVESTSLQNEPCTFPQVSDQTWRVLVKEDGAGLRNQSRVPNLQLGWNPSELIFLGRGTPPYLLAYGSGKLVGLERKRESEMIFQTIQTEPGNQMIGQATLGKRIALGGDLALQPPAQGRPWKKWLLWAVLGLGVGLLAAMARNLIREMNKEEK